MQEFEVLRVQNLSEEGRHDLALQLAVSLLDRDKTEGNACLVAWELLAVRRPLDALLLTEEFHRSLNIHYLRLIAHLDLNNRSKAGEERWFLNDAPSFLRDCADLHLAIFDNQWPLARVLSLDILEGEADSHALTLVGNLAFMLHDKDLMRRVAYHVAAHPRSQTLLALRILSAEGKGPHATAAVRELESLSAEPVSIAAYALGEFYRKSWRLNKAAAYYETAVRKLGPQNYESRSRLALVELKRLHLRSASRIAADALMLRPEGQVAMRVRVLSLLLLGAPIQAVKCIRAWSRAYRKEYPRRNKSSRT